MNQFLKGERFMEKRYLKSYKVSADRKVVTKNVIVLNVEEKDNVKTYAFVSFEESINKYENAISKEQEAELAKRVEDNKEFINDFEQKQHAVIKEAKEKADNEAKAKALELENARKAKTEADKNAKEAAIKLEKTKKAQEKAAKKGHPVKALIIVGLVSALSTGYVLKHDSVNKWLISLFTTKNVPADTNNNNTNTNTNTGVKQEIKLTQAQVVKLTDDYYSMLKTKKTFENIEPTDVLALVYIANVNNISAEETNKLINDGLLSDSSTEVFLEALGIFGKINEYNAKNDSNDYISFAKLVGADGQDLKAIVQHDSSMKQLLVSKDNAQNETLAIEYRNFISDNTSKIFDSTASELNAGVRFLISESATNQFNLSQYVSTATKKNLVTLSKQHQNLVQVLNQTGCFTVSKTK
jgi:hypothetical protein